MMKYAVYCTWVKKGHFLIDANDEKQAMKISKEMKQKLIGGLLEIIQGDYVQNSLIVTDVVKEATVEPNENL